LELRKARGQGALVTGFWSPFFLGRGFFLCPTKRRLPQELGRATCSLGRQGLVLGRNIPWGLGATGWAGICTFVISRNWPLPRGKGVWQKVSFPQERALHAGTDFHIWAGRFPLHGLGEILSPGQKNAPGALVPHLGPRGIGRVTPTGLGGSLGEQRNKE